jgi:hypothetical protein
MEKANKYKNKLNLLLIGGGVQEYGIKNYIKNLSDPDSILNLDTLDEIVTSLESIYEYNKNICESQETSQSYYGNKIECNTNDKYINLFNDLYINAKSKWKLSSCYKNNYHQCINFDEIIKNWAPNLYKVFKESRLSTGGSSKNTFLLKHYSKYINSR